MLIIDQVATAPCTDPIQERKKVAKRDGLTLEEDLHVIR